MAAQNSAEIVLPAVESVQLQLIDAAKIGDANRIRTLLAQGALLCQKDRFDYTPFDWAAIHGHVACLQIFLDELENNTPLDRRDAYYTTLQGIKTQHIDLGIFQRDAQNAELGELSTFLLKIYDNLGDWGYGISGGRDLLTEIYNRIGDQLSLNIVLNCFSSSILDQALISAGAQPATDDPDFLFKSLRNSNSRYYRQALLFAGEDPQTFNNLSMPTEQQIREYHLNRLMRFAIREEHEDLLRALIDEGTTKVTTFTNEVAPFSNWPPLDVAAWFDKVKMAKVLLDAGAPIEEGLSGGIHTPFHSACERNSWDVGQLLFESGASIKSTYIIELGVRNLGKQPFYKMLLQGSKVRYAPTKNDAKIAMQTIARLIYALNHLPAYVIYEIILFAAGEQNDDQGQRIAPEWTKTLRNSLAVLYLYKCNGNKLYHLWEQTMRCIIKDPEQQTLFISKLENFLRPFLGNEVIRLACSHLMQKIADDACQEQQSIYENDLFGEDFGRYYNHMAQGPLKIDGSDTP